MVDYHGQDQHGNSEQGGPVITRFISNRFDEFSGLKLNFGKLGKKKLSFSLEF